MNEKYIGTLKKIINAAKKEFAKKGFFKTTVEDITRRAGIAKGTYYIYFKSKEDVIKYMINEMADSVSRIIDIAINSLKSGVDDFKNFIKNFVKDALTEYLSIKETMITVLRSNYELSKELLSFKSENINKLKYKVKEILKLSMEKSYIRKIDIEIYTEILFMLMTNFFFEFIIEKKNSEKLDYYIDNISDFILYGLGGGVKNVGKNIK